MCCFSGDVSVSTTNIFARVDGGVQWLVYEMAIEARDDVAMVLPLPVAGSLDFIDLSGAPDLFEQLGALFPPDVMEGELLLALGDDDLAVQRVGAFDASFVPRLADMARLDRRFRIADAVWNARGEYADYGFAVFKLRRGEQRVHPMAMKFTSSAPDRVFFPTVHVHDGRLHEFADFDHELYYQRATGGDARAQVAAESIERRVDIASTRGACVRDLPVFRISLHGAFENGDVQIG